MTSLCLCYTLYSVINSNTEPHMGHGWGGPSRSVCAKLFLWYSVAFWFPLILMRNQCSLLLVFPYVKCNCLSLPLANCKMFSLCLVISNLTWNISMVSLVFTVLGIYLPPQVCGFLSNWTSFNYYYFQIFSYSSLFSFWDSITSQHWPMDHWSLLIFPLFLSLHAPVYSSFVL